MVLRNYYIWKSFVCNNFARNSGTYNIGATNIDGNTISYDYNISYDSYEGARRRNITLWSGLKPYVATATTISPNDYSIANSITSNFVNYQYTTTINIDDGCAKLMFNISGQNASNQTLIIDQMLVTKTYYSVIEWGNIQTNECLFVKQDLDNPITVPPAVGFNLVFEWAEA